MREGPVPRSNHKPGQCARMAGRAEGDASVFVGIKRVVGLAPVALALAVGLCGCTDFDTSGCLVLKASAALRLQSRLHLYTDRWGGDRSSDYGERFCRREWCLPEVRRAGGAAAGWSVGGGRWPWRNIGSRLPARGWRRYRHERMRCRRTPGPADRRQHRQKSGRRANGGTHLPRRPATRGLSVSPAAGSTEMDRVEMPAAQAAAPVPAKKKMVKKKPDRTKGQPKPDDKS